MLSNRYALTSLGKTALLVENILTNIICIPYEYRHVIAQTRTSAHDARAIVNQFMAPFFMVSCFQLYLSILMSYLMIIKHPWETKIA